MMPLDILIITSYFPTRDVYSDRAEDPRTKFLWDYAVEWKRSGNRVMVLHLPVKYPVLFSWMVHGLEKVLGVKRFKLGRFVQNEAAVQMAAYEADGIEVVRLPVTKFIPHRAYPERTLKMLAGQVNKVCRDRCWRAGVIVSDFLSPSLTIATALRVNQGAPVFQIIHETDLHYLRRHRAEMMPMLKGVCAMLYRSHALARRSVAEGLADKPTEYIFSGIPRSIPTGHPRRYIRRLLFAGSLIPRKRVGLLLKALAHPSIRGRFNLDLVGKGPCEPELRKAAADLQLQEQVRFLGHFNREQVFDAMRASDAFVMVSVETFGMVYIEAMSQGCPVIAAQGQGMEGIVRNGENGYVVELDNEPALVEALARLAAMDEDAVLRVSESAIRTAEGMRDDALAAGLLGKIKLHSGK